MNQLQIFTFLFIKKNILGNKKIRVGAKNYGRQGNRKQTSFYFKTKRKLGQSHSIAPACP